MTIDAANFSPQGRPSVDQVRAVWYATVDPSSRKVAKILTQRGFNVSSRTVARYAQTGWKELYNEGPGRPAPADYPPIVMPEAARVVSLDEIAGAVPPPEPAPETPPSPTATVPFAGPIEPPTKDELTHMDRLRVSLATKTDAELDRAEARARKIMNIVLMEFAAHRADVLMLVPDGAAKLVVAMSDAAPIKITGGAGQLPAEGDPRVIDGTTNPIAPEPEINEVTAAIRRFKQKAG